MNKRFIAATGTLVVLLWGCAAQELHREGVIDVDAGRVEEGLQKLEQAARENPDNLAYRYDLQARRAAVIQLLYAAGDRAHADGNFDEAEKSYRRILAIEPSNEAARQAIHALDAERRHKEAVAAAKLEFDAGRIEEADMIVRQVLAEDPAYTPAADLKVKVEATWEPPSAARRLRAGGKTPVTLEFRDAPTKMIFEVLSRQTGINFIFDKDVRSDAKTSIFVRDVPVEQAIELVLGQNQLARQVLAENMILIYPNTDAKQKEYQDQIVKTLYLTNTDAKSVQELLKTVLVAKTLFVNDAANVVVIRDTPEMVRMAEKLVASLDMVVPEVMMEVEVLEVNRSLLDELGITYPTTATMSMTPINGPPFTVNDLGNQNSSTITFTPPPSITVNLMKQASTTNTLASPRIRARNHEIAKILIGSRVPVITESVTPTAGTAITTGSVQYLDVGLQLEVEPDVHPDGVVAITIKLEVSSIIKEVRVISSGTLAYEIGTRNASTLLSLKDGDTAIIGGLIQDTDTRSSDSVPGLGDIPVIGRLFGSRSSNKGKSEIVLSITPRIIRPTIRPAGNTTEFWYGTEANTRGGPFASMQTSAPAAGAAALAPAPSEAVANGGAAIPPPGEVESAVAPEGPPPASDYASVAGAMVAPAPVLAPSAGPPTLGWDGPAAVKVGEQFSVALTLASDEPLVRLRAQARYNTAVLRLDSAEVGEVIPAEFQAASMPRINPGAGNVQMVVAASRAAPVQGTGNLLVLNFTALAASTSTPVSLQFAATGDNARDAGAVVPRPLPIAVNP